MKITLSDHSPALAGEWSEQNGKLQPSDVTYGSNKKVWWKGKCGHVWQATVKNRVNGSGCPYCAGRACLPGFNDMASGYPETAKEWSPKNLPLKPDEVMVNSNRRVWWVCKTCGHEWQARISDRTAGSACPCCSQAKLKPGMNDLETKYPELMEDWSERNIEYDPMLLSPLSRQNVWWKCHVCSYEWKAVVATRVRGQKCPLCSGRILIEGYNDLLTNEPELSAEWHPYRNPDTPQTIILTSDRLAWWKGKCGHSWQASVSDRRKGAGCPVCEQRKRQEEPLERLIRFAEEKGITCLQDDDSEVGLSFDIWFPDIRTAADFPALHPDTKKEELKAKVKSILCGKAGIRLITTQEDLEGFYLEYGKTQA